LRSMAFSNAHDGRDSQRGPAQLSKSCPGLRTVEAFARAGRAGSMEPFAAWMSQMIARVAG
jgi:hypothetical protein